MQLDEQISLADLVTRRADAAPVLAVLGLDFCCGGSARLGDACRDAGLDPADVIARLESDQPPAPDWAALAPPAMVDHLEATHHEYLRARLPYLSDLAEKVREVHGEHHPELAEVAATFEELRSDLEPHLLKEERVLFPMIRELYASAGQVEFHCGTLQNPIAVMSFEHDRAGELLRSLRSLTGGYTPPADACASYVALYAGLAELEADTHLHVHKENNVLFPEVVAEEVSRLAGG